MFVIYSLVVALLIVSGQALWKIAVMALEKSGHSMLTIQGLLRLISEPTLLLGVLVYAVATFGYIYLIGHYKYIQVQPLVVGSSLVFSFLIAIVFFKDQATLSTMAGFALILIGATLVIR